MTDKDKLQQLFNAALQDGSSLNKPLTRAFPESKVACAIASQTVPARVPPTTTEIPVAEDPTPAPDFIAIERVTPTPNAGLDAETSTELGKLLDAQLDRVSRGRRRVLLVTTLVVVGLIGGGVGWFMNSASRVSAFKSTLIEIRSVSDINGMMTRYQTALNKVATRGEAIEKASNVMAVDRITVPSDDPSLDVETAALTGEK